VEEEAPIPLTPERKRQSVFGLSALARKTKDEAMNEEGPARKVQVQEQQQQQQPQASGFVPSQAAIASVSPDASPAIGRTRRSLSVANLRDRIAGTQICRFFVVLF
jgi:hypothetical protein